MFVQFLCAGQTLYLGIAVGIIRDMALGDASEGRYNFNYTVKPRVLTCTRLVLVCGGKLRHLHFTLWAAFFGEN